MRYFGMPLGMWLLFGASFKEKLVSALGYDSASAVVITKAAKRKYKEIIKKLPEFEKKDRFKMNIVSCAMVGAFFVSMEEKPVVEKAADYYAAAMMTPPMKWFCRMSGKRKFTKKDIKGMKETAALKASDRNPYSWNMEYYPYEDGSGYEARFFTCGICTLMKELGIYDLTPALCRLDYTMSEAGGASRFVREYTLAAGGPYCDCGYKKSQMADKIQNAYHDSKDIYDDVLTQGNILSKLYIKVFWSGTDDNEIAGKVLGYIPDDFSGKLLDVPVGTGVFTYRKWQALTAANITCLDYSVDMIRKAEERMKNYSHISFVQGDVGALPLDTESCDIVLSMNGFHAFPDKAKAFQETYRVLKKGGKFIACFYIKGEKKITDWLVKNILSGKGWFTPPFHTREELKTILDNMYGKVEMHIDGSIVYFICQK